jgi:hypothetical protein
VSLFTERRRRRRQAEREAAGEILWGETISERARVSIAQLWANVINSVSSQGLTIRSAEAQALLAGTVTASVRWSTGGYPVCTTPEELAKSKAGTPELLDVFEALYEAIGTLTENAYDYTLRNLPSFYQEKLNEALDAHRVAYKMINGRILSLSGDPVHSATIEPTLNLLIDRRYERAQAAFRDSLRELQNRKPGDAITDAGTALQETLVELGCQGNALGPLIGDARKRGLIAGHDEKLTAGILKFLEWASADRSEKGDAHKHSDATIDDAWLAVHVVGALIRRLASDVPRAVRATTRSRR